MTKNTLKMLIGLSILAGFISCESDDSSIVDGVPDAIINTDESDAPPRGLEEDWFGHAEYLNRQYYESNMAVYYDDKVDRAIEWPFQFTQDIWDYTQNAYGTIGNGVLYAIFHSELTNSADFLTNYESSVAGSVIDIPLEGTEMTESEMTKIISEIGSLLEYSAKGVQGSPASAIWMDEFNHIFTYDTYLKLEMEAEATTIKDRFSANAIDGIYWFKDWYLPLYENYGANTFLNKFYGILSQNYPKDGDVYARDMNFGEFIHFMSGAAGEDLQPMAKTVFGWSEDRENLLLQARVNFPNLAYPFEAVSQLVDLSETATITVSKENDGGAGANEGSPRLIDNDPNSKFLTGNYAVYKDNFWLQQELETPDVVNKYSLISGNDAPARDPKSWYIAGSNDMQTWNELDRREDQSFSGRNQTKEFDFDNPIAYKYYRIYIYENGGDYNFQLSEWRLFSLQTLTAPEPVDYTFGATISVSKEHPNGADSAEGSSKLIDNDISTKMFLGGYTSDFWMQQDLEEAKIVVKYSLTSGNDADGRDPKDWELLGSNDGATWESLDTRTNVDFENRNQTKEFNVANETAYQYYRLNVISNNGDSNMQLSEWRLIGME